MQEARTRPAADRRKLFLAATLLAPIGILVGAELLLRILGVGGSYPLFVAAPGLPGYREANPDVIQRYYAHSPELAIDPIPFATAKPRDGYRIVVQGGSTAAGFPYGRWAGLAGMLGDRLEVAFPDREIEVISTAMAAVNSYTLLDLVAEIIEIEPDAVLLYAGHNEYVGVLGIGSALTPVRSQSATRLHLRLRELRLYQALQYAIGLARSFAGAPRDDASVARATLIARAAAGAHIPFESETYFAGVAQLRENLGAILAAYREAGIPVYVGTLASNEKSLPPFVSATAEGADREAWEELERTALAAFEAGDFASARTSLEALLPLDDRAAAPWFLLGRVEEAAGNVAAARAAYRNAKDRDQLRLRAPEAFNREIRALAAEHGAIVVDVQRHLTEAAEGGLIGASLLTEHVHPNDRGYFLLADSYYQALAEHAALGDLRAAPSRAEAERDMPLTAVDRLLADHTIRQLRAGFPFSAAREPAAEIAFPEPGDEIERIARLRHLGELDWLAGMERLLQYYRRSGQRAEAIVVARVAAQAFPTAYGPNFSAGMLYLQEEQFARARRYLERSLRERPDEAGTLVALIRANLALDDVAPAQAHFDRLQAIAPAHPAVSRFEARLRVRPN